MCPLITALSRLAVESFPVLSGIVMFPYPGHTFFFTRLFLSFAAANRAGRSGDRTVGRALHSIDIWFFLFSVIFPRCRRFAVRSRGSMDPGYLGCLVVR